MIYIDCTTTHSINTMTGIQRVVSNILEVYIADKEISQNIQPMIFTSRGFIPISNLQPHEYTQPKGDKEVLKNKNLLSPLKNIFSIQNIKVFLQRFPFLYKTAKEFYFYTKRFLDSKIHTEKTIVFTKKDTVLFLDAYWSLPIWDELKNIKKAEAKIIFVIYDLIPIDYPQFCDASQKKKFEVFFKNSLDFSDKLISISKTVMSDVKKYALDLKHKRANEIEYDYFYLGSNFSKNYKEDGVRQNIKSFFSDNIPVFLTVSTIEPRKNHAFILEAFDKLWKKGIDVKLCFIGKEGWKVEHFMKQIKSHKFLNDKFLFISDANDMELLYAYKNSRSLIFASFTEGFGLPIVESLNFNLPVLASDIPIHREIGADYIEYFDLENVETLVEKVMSYKEQQKKYIKFSSLDWDGSAKMLFRKVADNSKSEIKEIR